MTYQTLSNYNVTGNADQILVYVANNVTIFTPMLLATFWLIITLSTYFGTKKFYGNADFWASLMVGGFLTSFLAMFLTVSQGIISMTVLTTFVALFIVFTIIYFITGRE